MQERNKSFFTLFFAALRGLNTLVGAFISLSILFGLVVAFSLLSGKAPDEDGFLGPKDVHAVLVLNPSGRLVESADRVSPLRSDTVVLSELLQVIEHALDDDRVQLLLLRLENLFGLNSANIKTLSTALAKFKTAGKKVVAYGHQYSQNQYLLASHANEILLHPMGGVFLTGFGLYRSYFAATLDKLGIEMHLYRAGSHKSAGEPFIQNHMSEQSRKSNQAIIETFWRVYKETLQASRGLNPGQIDNLIEKPDQALANSGSPAKLAMDEGFIDQLATEDQLHAHLIKLLGDIAENNVTDFTYFNDYLFATEYEFGNDLPSAYSKVALITAEGPIVDNGEDCRGSCIAADVMKGLIRKARKNDQVKALVVRLNTPGGSAFASELIRQELQLIKEEGKPVVISMAQVAASGGYWISATANEIWANSTTVTGSIGVFALVPTLQKAAETLGISVDGVHIGALSGVTFANEFPPEFDRVLQLNVDHIYQSFIDLVAKGRNLPVSQLDQIAGGRVWTGEKAHELGLVDNIGGLDEALAAAAQLANLNEWETQHLQAPPPWWNHALRRLSQSIMIPEIAQLSALTNTMSDFNVGLDMYLKPLKNAKRPYALCLNCEVYQ